MEKDDDADIDWQAVRQDYESSKMSVAAVARKYRISTTRLYAYLSNNGWAYRQMGDHSGRRGLIFRMRRMLERQITFMETNMTGSDEKEVALLGNMVRTLEKLIELDGKQSKTEPNKKQSREMAALRKKLADRIDQLKKAK